MPNPPMFEKLKKRAKRRVARSGRIAIEVLAATAGALLLACASTFDGHVGILGSEPRASALLFGLGAILILISTLLGLAGRLRLRHLEDELPGLREDADLARRFVLRLIRSELEELTEVANHYSNERISLYRHEPDGFTLVGRFSKCPPFRESLGREVIPDDGGVIGAAWESGVASRTDLPAAGPISGAPNKQWLDAQQRYFGIQSALAASLTMRSQSYTAYRIEASGRDGSEEGAIVFESTVTAEEGTRQGMLIEQADLDGLVKPAAPRLARLLDATRSLSRAELRALLDEQQGPNRPRP